MPRKYKVKDQWGREIGEAVEVSDTADEAAGCLAVLTLLLLIGALVALVKYVLIPLVKLLVRGLQRTWASPTGRAWLLLLLSTSGIVAALMIVPTPVGPVWAVVTDLGYVLHCALGGTCVVSIGAAWLALVEVVGLGIAGGLALWQISRWVGLRAEAVGPGVHPRVKTRYHRPASRPGQPGLGVSRPVSRPPSRPSVPPPPRRNPASGGRVERPRRR